MLGSSHVGETVNAGRQAHAMLREAGTTWCEVLNPDDTVAVAAARVLLAECERLRAEIHRFKNRPRLLPWEEPDDVQEALTLGIHWRDRLTDWEQGFVASVENRRSLLERQRNVIWDIAKEIGRLARTGA
jgi:hypothetical protein